jgi:phosphohistidine swiveling domain-containing protein
MLHSYLDHYVFFPWKPAICAIEKCASRWDVYYTHEDILESQRLCLEIFEQESFDENVLKPLQQQITKLRTMADAYKRMTTVTSMVGEEYFHLYKEFLHHYSFTNEFCFMPIEERVLKSFGTRENRDVLFCGCVRDMRESDSYQAYKMMEDIRKSYRHCGAIDETAQELFVAQFAYLFNWEGGGDVREHIRQMIFAPEGNWASPPFLPVGKTPQGQENVDSENSKFMRLRSLRALRLFMRETMMFFNYHFTNALERTISALYGGLLSESERKKLIRNLSKDDLLHLEELELMRLIKNDIHTVLYANNEIMALDRRKNLGNVLTDEVVIGKGKLKGTVVFGVGAIIGKVKTSYAINDAQDKTDQYIYITKSLHPKDLFILSGIQAIIVDEGGILSHASIMAQELRIPCITNTRLASHIYTAGDTLSVDFDRGEITLIEKGRNDSNNCLRELDFYITDRDLYGNKCVNLCKQAGDFTIANGYAIDSTAVKRIFFAYRDENRKLLSDEDTHRIQALFPVIVRSSSLYEDTHRSTGAGLLESLEAIQSMEQVYAAIAEVCESMQTKAFEKYSQWNAVGSEVFPSVMIQEYHTFLIHGTILIRKDHLVVEYSDELTQEVQNFRVAIDDISSEKNDFGILNCAITQLLPLIKRKANHLIEFGIESQKCYLLQIRESEGV